MCYFVDNEYENIPMLSNGRVLSHVCRKPERESFPIHPSCQQVMRPEISYSAQQVLPVYVRRYKNLHNPVQLSDNGEQSLSVKRIAQFVDE